MFPYDSALLTIAQTSPQTIPDVLATMQAMDSLMADGDGLKWFNRLYLQVTQAVETQVSGGGFADPAWLAQLDAQFARLYFDALRNFLSGQATPGCWRALFERRNQTAIARIQFALAGVNAHINHDLPLALMNTAQVERTVPAHGTTQYQDYTNLNTTLDSLIEEAKRELHVRLLGDPLPPVTHLEDALAAWSVAAAREAAWTNSEILWNSRNVLLLESRFLNMLDGLTALAGKTLLAPVPCEPAVMVKGT